MCKYKPYRHFTQSLISWGFPGGSEGKESVCNAGDPGSLPGVGKILWSKKWQLIPWFLPGEFHGQRCLAGYSSQDHWAAVHGAAKTRTWLNWTERLTLSSFLVSSVHHHGTADWGLSCWVLWIADTKKLMEQVIYCEEYLWTGLPWCLRE